MKLRSLLLFGLILFSAMAVTAQPKEDSTKKYKQLEELFRLIKLEEACQVTVQQAADQLIAQNEALQSKRPEIESFYVKHLGFEYMKGVMGKLYLAQFSDSEIKELIRFYKTPAGKKFATASNTITAEAYKIYSSNLEANQKELQDLINQPNQ
ncbi:MAG: DUF2059 domain-containing protein [Chitinophagaceae bacterium]|nr:DUF2059 domain-containing protein [Chitinophagaceae bacterium]